MVARYFQNGMEMFFCIHATAKHTIKSIGYLEKILKCTILNFLFSILCIPISLLLLLILTLILVPMSIFKWMLKQYLKIKYKDDFLELMQIGDSMWNIENEKARSVINVILIFEFNKTEGDLTEFIKELVAKRMFTIPRYSSVRRRCMGYYFFMKNQLTVDDIVSEINSSSKSFWDKETLEKTIQTYANSPFPKDDTAVCQLLVGQQPIKINDQDEEQYPILLRFHHSVGDGTSLLSNMISVSDDSSSILKEHVQKSITNSTAKKSFFKRMADIFKKIFSMFIMDLYISPLVTKPDLNLIHGVDLSGEKVISCYVEENSHYISKIKRIKKALPGANFSEVIMTALSASLEEYFRKNTQDIPEKIKLIFALSLNRENLTYRVRKLVNTFSAGHINLPIRLNSTSKESTQLIDRFNALHEEVEKFKNSMDALVVHWQLHTFGDLLPVPVLKVLRKFNLIDTISFSNLPGLPKLEFLGQKLNNLMFWTPHCHQLGVGISFITYDDRFQVGLIVDKVLISDSKDAGNILKNIFKYIDEIDIELLRTS